MKQEILIKNGYSFDYKTSSNTGSVANIDSNDLIIDVDKIGNSYHCSFRLNGIYIQIWCKSYEVRRISY